ncbi:MAG: xanthine dehydrogenase family protein subunit M [Acetobacteraceae bacterium]|nr:xanthine dehydrogenase family protein subunit M [Acetobacteraceae bacterium]
MNYVAPTTVADAVKILAGASGPTRVMSGGTDLLVQLRTGRLKPELIIDTKKIPGIIGITQNADGGFTIGAATSGALLGEHTALGAAYPGVVEAANLIGSTQVQGRASLAGNLCNASPAADSVPAVIAAGGTVTIAGPNGTRTAAVESIVTGPGKTSLAKGEFITAFHLPPIKGRTGDAYLRFIPRTEMDIAVVGCGVSVTLDASGTITAAKISLGAVAPTQVLVDPACIIGSKLDDAALARLDAAAQAMCKPIDDKRGTIEFRTKVAGVLARRTAAIAVARAGGR